MSGLMSAVVMTHSQTRSKLISLFVMAFLCLNAGGVLCLAYCGQAMAASAKHCPLKKQTADCPHSNRPKTTPGTPSFEATSIRCCVLPVSVFGAPLEVRAGTELGSTPVVLPVTVRGSVPTSLDRSRQITHFYYRPPPNDRRIERIRNQVIRI
jgi:hypothetical protein